VVHLLIRHRIAAALRHTWKGKPRREKKKSGVRRASGARKVATYDLHNHVIPESVLQAIERNPDLYGTRIEQMDGKRYFDVHGRSAQLLPEFYDPEAKIAWMDRVGMDVSVISVGPPIFFCWLAPDAGAETVRLANDGIAQMVARHPDRLRGMAHLPMQDPEAAVAEFERVVKGYRFKAGANHIVIGTDHPFDMAPKGDAKQLGQVDAIPGLTAAEREWIRSKTAKSLLRER